jgi:hypothetical protein
VRPKWRLKILEKDYRLIILLTVKALHSLTHKDVTSYGNAKIKVLAFLTSALDENERLDSCPSLSMDRDPGSH